MIGDFSIASLSAHRFQGVRCIVSRSATRFSTRDSFDSAGLATDKPGPNKSPARRGRHQYPRPAVASGGAPQPLGSSLSLVRGSLLVIASPALFIFILIRGLCSYLAL